MWYTHLIWIIPTLMLLIIVAGWNWKPSNPNTPNFSWVTVLIGLIAVGVIAGLWWGVPAIVAWWKSDGGKDKETRTEQITRVIKVGREKKLCRFSDYPNGVIEVKIELGEVDFYPKGGKIRIIPPLPATPWEDEPGTTMPRVKRPPGWYTIVKIHPSATGVEIWN